MNAMLRFGGPQMPRARDAAPVSASDGRRALALLGAAVLGLTLLLVWAGAADGLSRWPALAAGMFMAVSPPAVYYSRYFVQETMLATFSLATFLCVREWWRSGLTRWAMVRWQ